MDVFAGRKPETQHERDVMIVSHLGDGIYATDTSVAGLEVIPAFITPEEEIRLVKFADSVEWDTGLKRRVQHYGYRYNYLKRSVDSESFLGDIPEELVDICARLDRYGLHRPQQVIVNEYQPGQGIAPHVDAPVFGPVVCTLSCLHEVPMVFQLGAEKVEVSLPRRSLAVLRGPSRVDWRHSIASRMTDRKDKRKIRRQRRVSFTFRSVEQA